MQSILNSQSFEILEEESRRRGKSVSELVREAIDTCYPAREARVLKKLKAVEDLGQAEAPVSSWEEIEEEIHKGSKDMDKGRRIFDRFRAIVYEVIPIAVMRNNDMDTIISADKDFDLVNGIQRIDPLDFDN